MKRADGKEYCPGCRQWKWLVIHSCHGIYTRIEELQGQYNLFEDEQLYPELDDE